MPGAAFLFQQDAERESTKGVDSRFAWFWAKKPQAFFVSDGRNFLDALNGALATKTGTSGSVAIVGGIGQGYDAQDDYFETPAHDGSNTLPQVSTAMWTGIIGGIGTSQPCLIGNVSAANAGGFIRLDGTTGEIIVESAGWDATATGILLAIGQRVTIVASWKAGALNTRVWVRNHDTNKTTTSAGGFSPQDANGATVGFGRRGDGNNGGHSLSKFVCGAWLRGNITDEQARAWLSDPFGPIRVAPNDTDEAFDFAAAGGATVALAGWSRSMARMQGLTLAQTQPVAGTARSTARLTGALGQTQPLAGLARVVARLTGTLGQSQAIAGKARSGARLLGVTLTQSQPITGTTRSGARLTGASLLQSLPLAGTLRTMARLLGTLNVTAPGAVVIAGTARAIARMLGATVTQTIALTGRTRSLSRTQGVLTQTIPLAGTSRSTSRLRGALTQSVAVGGVIRAGSRLAGASVVQSLSLVGGVARLWARLLGVFTAFGPSSEANALSGSVVIGPALTGTVMLDAAITGRPVVGPALDGIITIQPS